MNSQIQPSPTPQRNRRLCWHVIEVYIALGNGNSRQRNTLVNRNMSRGAFILALVMLAPLPRSDAQKPEVQGSEFTLRTEVDLLSVAVRVTDRNDNEIHGLTANQFSLYEDGVPQRISFFDAESDAVSLGILLDVSGSMGATGKLDQAKDALARILGTMGPKDETLFLRFHVDVDKVVDFTSDSSRILLAISQTAATENSTSLYDAIARALCYMRNARHHRQALLVVTDGADQHSHRTLGDLIPIVRASQAQVFIIGALSKEEYEIYRESRSQKISLVTRQEVDNPLTAFKQLAGESGAESFFPASPDKLQEAVKAVAHQLRTQYTLAYYPKSKGGGFHKIDVRVAQPGARVRARRGFEGVPGPAAGCEDENLKPYPYESKVTAKNGCTVYHEDFQNTSSGWPNKKGYHYKSGAYEIVNAKRSEPIAAVDTVSQSMRAPIHPFEDVGGTLPLEGVLVANGPSFDDLNASASVEWKSGGGRGDQAAAPGLVFHLDNRGYYAVLVSREALMSARLAFKLVKKYHSEQNARDLLPWTELPLTDQFLGKTQQKISVQCRGPLITILFPGAPVAKFEDDEFKEGLAGMILYGAGRAVFRDLLVEETPHAAAAMPLTREPSPSASQGTTPLASLPSATGALPEGSVLPPLPPAAGPAATLQGVNPPPEQTQAREAAPQFRIKVQRNLVVVGVVVRDSNGRAVSDLHKEDFRLLADGQPQEIAGFAVEVSKPQHEAVQAQVATAAPAGATNSLSLPSAAALPQRFIALFFDDLHGKPEDFQRSRDAAWRYMTTSARLQDHVAILTASGNTQVDFTSDQAKLHDALLHLAPRGLRPAGCPDIDEYEAYLVDKEHSSDALAVAHAEAIQCQCGSRAAVDPMTECPAMMQSRAGGDTCAQAASRDAEVKAGAVWSYAENQARYSLQALENSVSRLAAMPGQRSLVLVSTGFLTETQAHKIDAIINHALQQEVVISAIYAPGLQAPLPEEIEENSLPSGLVKVELFKTMMKDRAAIFSTSVLASLSSGTGGVFFYNNNDFDDGFRRAAAVPEVLYVLAFSPQEVNLNGKFHPLKVTLNTREHFTVQARRGYFASEAALGSTGDKPR
jgi:Ca-activated chloride channel homolog